MTTQREQMTIADHIQAARNFLDHSNREFAAGERMQESEKLWGAASQAVTALAKTRGWPHGRYNHRKHAVETVAGELNDTSLVLEFKLAHKFHANFYYDFLEDEDVQEDRLLVSNFVHRILAMVEDAAS